MRTLQSLIVILIILLLPAACLAEKVYVFIQTHNETGAGQNEDGDVIDIRPFTKEQEPTETERNSMKIIVLDLSESEKAELLKPIKEEKQDGEIVWLKQRMNKIDYEKLSDQKQEANIIKTELFENVVDKTTIAIDIIKP